MRRSWARLRAGALLAAAAALWSPGAVAVAHPLGLPAFAQITATEDGGARIVWNAAADDVAALAGSLGADVDEGGLLTRTQDAQVSASSATRNALTEGIVLFQDGQACDATVEVTSLVERGATLAFTCPRPVRDVEVRITLLTGLDERYRTLGIAGTDQGTERFMFTAAAPAHEMTLDAAAAGQVGLAAGPGEQADAGLAVRQPFGGSLPFESAFVGVIDRTAGLGGLVLGLLVALGVGAAHGLAPGHGKAIAAAYLVGDRGRARDAVLLGTVVALMHTGSVLALGFALYAATRRPATFLLSAWLQMLSGLVVAGLGAWLLVRRARERRRGGGHAHDHAHDHSPAGGEVSPLSWTGLVTLGAAGGLLPSPSALLVLFTALAVGRVAYGLSLIAVFSVGLAATVSLVGLAALKGRDVVRARGGARLEGALRAAPVVAAAAVTVLGLAVASRAGAAVLAVLR